MSIINKTPVALKPLLFATLFVSKNIRQPTAVADTVASPNTCNKHVLC